MRFADSTERFSSRVEQYGKYRPGYPPEVLQLLKDECGLGQESVVADIASGTGIFSKLILENGNTVFGVEPNGDMRQAAEAHLSAYRKFVSVNGRAEATTLPEGVADLVTAAQAAHWFDLPASRREFQRILKAGAWCALVWNDRRLDSSAFLREYEQLLSTWGTDYGQVKEKGIARSVEDFFAGSRFRRQVFAIAQEFDYAGLEGRLSSSSYIPLPNQANFEPMMHDLIRIFDMHSANGRVRFEYDTNVYYGQLG